MIGMSVAAEIRNSWGRRTGVSSFAVRCDSPVLGGRVTGFNWPQPDHFRVVTLPWANELAEAIDRLGNFLSSYKQ